MAELTVESELGTLLLTPVVSCRYGSGLQIRIHRHGEPKPDQEFVWCEAAIQDDGTVRWYIHEKPHYQKQMDPDVRRASLVAARQWIDLDPDHCQSYYASVAEKELWDLTCERRELKRSITFLKSLIAVPPESRKVKNDEGDYVLVRYTPNEQLIRIARWEVSLSLKEDRLRDLVAYAREGMLRDLRAQVIPRTTTSPPIERKRSLG